MEFTRKPLLLLLLLRCIGPPPIVCFPLCFPPFIPPSIYNSLFSGKRSNPIQPGQTTTSVDATAGQQAAEGVCPTLKVTVGGTVQKAHSIRSVTWNRIRATSPFGCQTHLAVTAIVWTVCAGNQEETATNALLTFQVLHKVMGIPPPPPARPPPSAWHANRGVVSTPPTGIDSPPVSPCNLLPRPIKPPVVLRCLAPSRARVLFFPAVSREATPGCVPFDAEGGGSVSAGCNHGDGFFPKKKKKNPTGGWPDARLGC